MKPINWQIKFLVIPWVLMIFIGELGAISLEYGRLFEYSHVAKTIRFAAQFFIAISAAYFSLVILLRDDEWQETGKAKRSVKLLIPVIILMAWASLQFWGQSFIELIARSHGEVLSIDGTILSAGWPNGGGGAYVMTFRLDGDPEPISTTINASGGLYRYRYRPNFVQGGFPAANERATFLIRKSGLGQYLLWCKSE